MVKRILVLGGTAEGHELAQDLLQYPAFALIYSLAGCTRNANLRGLEQASVRRGGFGGTLGLMDYLTKERIDFVIDVTHPFAVNMSAQALEACREINIPYLRVERPPWEPIPGDHWIIANDVACAPTQLRALRSLAPLRVLLAIGTRHTDIFMKAPVSATYWVRSIEPPSVGLDPLRYYHLRARGPFTEEEETALLEHYHINVLVCKNSGGAPMYAKVAAARALSLPVIMIERCRMSPSREASQVDDIAAAKEHLVLWWNHMNG